MNNKDEIEPVEVFAGTTWQAELLKSLLEDSGIEAFIIDEIMGTLNPWWTGPGGFGSVKVFVSTQDLDKAKPVVEKFQKQL